MGAVMVVAVLLLLFAYALQTAVAILASLFTPPLNLGDAVTIAVLIGAATALVRYCKPTYATSPKDLLTTQRYGAKVLQ